MRDGERKIRQEDCHEASLGAGILTLTNQRIAFDKTHARIMDFTKHMGDTVMEASLSDVTRVWKEGLLIKKVCVSVGGGESPEIYKFGVLNPGGWANSIQDALDDI